MHALPGCSGGPSGHGLVSQETITEHLGPARPTPPSPPQPTVSVTASGSTLPTPRPTVSAWIWPWSPYLPCPAGSSLLSALPAHWSPALWVEHAGPRRVSEHTCPCEIPGAWGAGKAQCGDGAIPARLGAVTDAGMRAHAGLSLVVFSKKTGPQSEHSFF